MEPCKRCRGAGYLRRNVLYGDPTFGKPIACDCKVEETQKKRQQQLLALSGLDRLWRYRSTSFETFKDTLPGVRDAYIAAYNFAHFYSDPEEEEARAWLVLTGRPGCGKTHLAIAIAKVWVAAGKTVLIETVPDLLDHLRAAFAPTAQEHYDALFKKMKEADLLVLDDLGAQQSSPWATEKLFQLLNYRYNYGLATVITSNDIYLIHIDERVHSRLTDISLVRLVKMEQARDYRPVNQQQTEEEE